MRDLRTRTIVWGLVGLLAGLRTWLGGRDESVPITLTQALLLEVPSWLLWIPLTPVVLGIVARATQRGPLHVAIRHGTLLTLTLGAGAALSVIALLAFPDRPPRLHLGGAFLGMVSLRSVPVVAVYAMIAAIGTTARREAELDRRRSEESEMRARLARAELEALRARIHPHFLYNALNACSSLVDERPHDAKVLLARLGTVLRAAFDGQAREVVPLHAEMDVVSAFLDIERARFGERLHVVFDVEDSVRDASVPALVVQPLAENAARHGVAPVRRPCTIRVEARRDGDDVLIAVRDDGAGIDEAYREGAGLSITRERVRRRYGPRYGMSVRRGIEGGTTVELRLPFEDGAVGAGT